MGMVDNKAREEVAMKPILSKTVEEYETLDNKQVNMNKEKTALQSRQGLFGFLGAADLRIMVYVAILSIFVRFAFLDHPGVVVFDEVHFGGFAGKYLRHEFFADLHPPLARLLVTFSAWVGGFDGVFRFYDIGADYYKNHVPYVTMRAFNAMAGAVVPLIAFMTLRAVGVSVLSSVVASSVIVVGKNSLLWPL